MAGIPGGLESDSEDDEMNMVHYDDSIFHSTPRVTDVNSYERAVKLENSGINIKMSPGVERSERSVDNRENISTKKPVYLASPTVALDDLRIAVLGRKLEVIINLFNHGIEVDSILKSEWTALMYACNSGFPEIVEHLIAQGANVNYEKKHFSPLMALCSAKGQLENELLTCCKLLLANGAKIDVWDRHHMTALMYAARENHIDIIRELIKNNVELNRVDYTGWSALCWAASKGHGKVIKLLLDADADINIITSKGDSAIDIAFNTGNDEIGNILMKLKNGILNLKSTEVLILDQQRLTQTEDSYEVTDCQYKTPLSSTFREMELCLTGLKLQEWIPLFQNQAIEFSDFLLLTDQELINMGVDKIGVRKRLLEGIKSIHGTKWERSSVHNLKHQSFITCPDAVRAMANIASHMRYINSSIKYLRRQIETTPRILELGQESANVIRLIEETSLSYGNCNLLKDELRNFNKQLDRIKDNVELLPGDFIGTKAKNRSSFKPFVAITISTAVLGIVLAWQKPDWFQKWTLILQPRGQL